MGRRGILIRRVEEDALHIREVLLEASTGAEHAATEMDSLEIEWSALITENLPELEAAWDTGDLDDLERRRYERLRTLLHGMTPLLRLWRFAEPAEVLECEI